MTLLIIAEPSDETAVHFAAFARRSRGVDTVVASGFGAVEVTVTVERDLRKRCKFLADGRTVAAILNRGPVGLSSQESSVIRFAAEERYAAMWSALALWPGPVINRPSVYGYPPRLDPLEIAALSPELHASGVIANNHEMQGNYAYRLDNWSEVDPTNLTPYEVIYAVELDELRARRVLVAGAETFDVSGPGHLLDGIGYTSHIESIRAWLESRLVDFAMITLHGTDRPGGAYALLEVSPWTHRSQFESVEDAVYSALLERLSL